MEWDDHTKRGGQTLKQTLNYDELSLLDCSALYDFKGKQVVIEHGKVTGIVEKDSSKDWSAYEYNHGENGIEEICG